MIEVLDRQDQQQDSLGMAEMTTPPSKAVAEDILGRFREVISDPLNLLIERGADGRRRAGQRGLSPQWQ
jgi:hypothetical protein